jgi:hypothetical protein
MSSTRFVFISGAKRHADYAGALFDLRQSTGQDRNATTDPLWFASSATGSKRRPWTVLKLENDRPVGAVMLREQTRYGIPLGYYFGCDAAGDEFVIAPPHIRQSILFDCLEAFMGKHRSVIVSIAGCVDYSQAAWGRMLYGADLGTARYRVPLLETYEKTLQQFGARTRRNLRHHLRQAHQQQVQFQGSLSVAERAEAASHLLLRSDYSMSAATLAEYLATIARTPDNFASGMRSASGEWLSCVMGWREGGRTYVFFQLNHAAHRRDSLSTTMRAFLMQNERTQGSEELVLVSYSSRLMEGGCVRDPRHDLLLARPSWRLALLKLTAPYFRKYKHRLRTLLASESTATRFEI